MTASRYGDQQICSISRVSFLSESLTPNGLPKHSFIMVYKAIGLRVDVYQYHFSSYGKLDQMGKVINPSQDPICPNCHEEEQDLVHWLSDCPALLSVRQRVFGCHQGSLEWLATRPGDVVVYARKTLVNLDA